MELNYDDLNFDPQIRTDLYYQINGLNTFKKALEKDFFSTVKITSHCCPQDEAYTKIVVEMYCNLSLAEMLSHYNKGNWGTNFEINTENSPFQFVFHQLCEQNTIEIDIEEFTLFLKDTSIIINSTAPYSIPIRWDALISEMGSHFVHFTKGLTEMPFEIYLPVFMGTTTENIPALLAINTGTYNQNDYSRYWGLYFESQEEAVIYDLENKSIIEEDLFMINR